jgi:hypothetical protein
MSRLGIANGHCVDDHRLRRDPIQDRFPGFGVVFAVGEQDDRSAFGMILVVKGVEGRGEPGGEVGPAGTDLARSQCLQRLDHGAQVLGQRTSEDPATRERHDGNTVASSSSQRLDEALGRLDGDSQPAGHGVGRPHAPADVDGQDHVVPGGERRGIGPSPSWLGQPDNQANRPEQPPR